MKQWCHSGPYLQMIWIKRSTSSSFMITIGKRVKWIAGLEGSCISCFNNIKSNQPWCDKIEEQGYYIILASIIEDSYLT